jgi:hypothetical protein
LIIERYGSAGDSKVMYVAVADIGATAAVALKNIDKYNGRHIPVCFFFFLSFLFLFHHQINLQFNFRLLANVCLREIF